MSKKKAKKKKLRLVMITWEDAWVESGVKFTLEHAKKVSEDRCIQMDVGFVIEDNEEYITYAARWSIIDNEPDSFKILHKVPKPYVIEIKELKQLDCEALNGG